MNGKIHWSLLPVAVIMTAALAMAQGPSQGVQSSLSTVTPVESYPSTDTTMDRPADARQMGASQAIAKTFLDLSQAFADRDPSALRRIWPSIPAATSDAVGKSFRYFTNTSRRFNPEEIQIKDDKATVSGSYSGSFIKGSKVVPSSGTFHATLVKTESGWILSSLRCN